MNVLLKKHCFSSFIIYFDLFLSLKRVQFDIFIMGQSSCQFPMHLEKNHLGTNFGKKLSEQ